MGIFKELTDLTGHSMKSEILITEAMAWPTSSDKWKALLRIHSIHVSWPIYGRGGARLVILDHK